MIFVTQNKILTIHPYERHDAYLFQITILSKRINQINEVADTLQIYISMIS